MRKFRKKPVVIEAMQWKENAFNADHDFWDWFTGDAEHDDSDGLACDFRIQTLEGEMHVSDGDWIIKGVNGEFYPCKPDIFAKTYEAVEESP